MSTLGKIIRELREKKGLTLREFASQVEISPPFLSDLEHDKRRPSEEKLKIIAKKLSINFDELKKYDGRLNEEVKDWLNEKPLMGSLMRKMAQMPAKDREKFVEKIEKEMTSMSNKKK